MSHTLSTCALCTCLDRIRQQKPQCVYASECFIRENVVRFWWIAHILSWQFIQNIFSLLINTSFNLNSCKGKLLMIHLFILWQTHRSFYLRCQRRNSRVGTAQGWVIPLIKRWSRVFQGVTYPSSMHPVGILTILSIRSLWALNASTHNAALCVSPTTFGCPVGILKGRQDAHLPGPWQHYRNNKSLICVRNCLGGALLNTMTNSSLRGHDGVMKMYKHVMAPLVTEGAGKQTASLAAHHKESLTLIDRWHYQEAERWPYYFFIYYEIATFYKCC